MLLQLTIKNFGLIDELNVDFLSELNILTGETGAGKSIIIDALRIALGDKIHPSQVRDSKQPCIFEAVFQIKKEELKQICLLESYIEEDDLQLIIHRTFSPEGRNKIKCNGQSITLGQLREIGNYLIDFHGPHDHQLLFTKDSHRQMLDRLINFGSALDEYQHQFAQYLEIQSKINKLKELSASKEREMDLLAHQIKELEQVPLSDEKYEELVQERTKINNAEKLNEYIRVLLNLLQGDSSGTSENIRKAFSPLRDLNRIDDKTSGWIDSLTQIQDLNDQLLIELKSYAEDLSFDQHHANTINDKFDVYDDIKRKYGPSLAEAQEFYNEAKEKHDLLLNLQHNDSQLKGKLIKLQKVLSQKAGVITNLRKKTAKDLKKTIELELSQLGIAHVEFEARVEGVDFNDFGQDEVVFFISPNAGEPLKPLAEIVSSGEAARVMLAMKKALINVDPIPVLIFDEIDAQIGGRLGSVIGHKLREISQYRQVILITHLPQIASFGQRHLKVKKALKNKRAVTYVQVLTKEERIKELAKMMSGEKETGIAIKHANDMLIKANC